MVIKRAVMCAVVDMSLCRYGRVNYVLAQRLQLLQEVSRLQQSFGVTADMSYTCETAGYFYIYQVCTFAFIHGV